MKKMRGTLFQSDKAHVFLFPHHLHAETKRERQTDSESSRYGTHTRARARTSAAEALFCVGYLVFYNNAQRERKRENERLVHEFKENVSRRSLPKHGGEDVGFIFEEDETEQPR